MPGALPRVTESPPGQRIRSVPVHLSESLGVALRSERSSPSLLDHTRGRGEPGFDDGPRWADIPSERFAEAVVVLVNGERVRHAAETPIDPAVVEVVERCGRGAPTSAGR